MNPIARWWWKEAKWWQFWLPGSGFAGAGIIWLIALLLWWLVR